MLALFVLPFRSVQAALTRRPVALAANTTTPKRTDTKPGVGSDKQAGAAVIRNEWSFKKLRAAERQAEAGSLFAAVSICEWLLSDDRISATLSARVEQLFGLTPTFEEDETREPGAAPLKLQEAERDFWASYPENALTPIVKWAILLGVAPARHNWTAAPDHNNRLLPKPRLWYPQTLEWSWQDQVWSVRDMQGVRHIITPGDGEWILHTPYSPDRPWSYGLWRAIARWVLLKALAAEEWSSHSAKPGMYVINSPASSTKEQRQELADAIANAEDNPIVALPVGFTMDLLNKTADTQAIFDAQIKTANDSIAILIRGANLSTNVQGGSKAAAESQKETGDDAKLRFDANSLTTTLHEQSLKPWGQYNFGDASVAPWPKYPVEEEEDQAERAAMLVDLTASLTTFDTLGFEFDVPKLQDEFGLTFITGRPNPTRLPPAPTVPGGDNGDGTTKAPAKKADPKKTAKKEARARILASGGTEDVEGFHDGQEFIDDLVDESTRAAAEMLQNELRDVIKIVTEGASLDAIEQQIATYYKTQDPERLARQVERAFVLANLAGRTAVLQDL